MVTGCLPFDIKSDAILTALFQVHIRLERQRYAATRSRRESTLPNDVLSGFGVDDEARGLDRTLFSLAYRCIHWLENVDCHHASRTFMKSSKQAGTTG